MKVMNRRGFLAALMGAAVLDPERLLWVPGRKLISIPKPPQVVIGATLLYWANGRTCRQLTESETVELLRMNPVPVTMPSNAVVIGTKGCMLIRRESQTAVLADLCWHKSHK